MSFTTSTSPSKPTSPEETEIHFGGSEHAESDEDAKQKEEEAAKQAKLKEEAIEKAMDMSINKWGDALEETILEVKRGKSNDL
jgi:pimeloyl-CoA synthetase